MTKSTETDLFPCNNQKVRNEIANVRNADSVVNNEIDGVRSAQTAFRNENDNVRNAQTGSRNENVSVNNAASNVSSADKAHRNESNGVNSAENVVRNEIANVCSADNYVSREITDNHSDHFCDSYALFYTGQTNSRSNTSTQCAYILQPLVYFSKEFGLQEESASRAGVQSFFGKVPLHRQAKKVTT